MNVLRGVRSIQEIDSDSSETNQEGIKKEEALIAINSVIVLIKEEKRIIKILNDEAACSSIIKSLLSLLSDSPTDFFFGGWYMEQCLVRLRRGITKLIT